MVVWSKTAKTQLQKAFDYISQDSIQNAVKVKDAIIDLTIYLPKHPQKYPADKYKQNNDGSYRAFEVYHYRISYRLFKNDIQIVRLRHTSMSPLIY
jgi:plasmid stabilization system protein ParE